MRQKDHIEPTYREGTKDETDYEQLVCGLDVPSNWRDADISDNSRKSDRFLPYRLIGDALPPCEAGDVALFYVEGEWVECEFLGERWYEETTRTGRYGQARQGRASVRRGDGYIGWRDRVTEEELAEVNNFRIAKIKEKVERGERWGFMVNKDPVACARGGATGGPKTATARNAYLRTLTKIIRKDGMTIRCEPGVIASRIVEQIVEMDPDITKFQCRDVHAIWDGKTCKGWELQAIW
jgi:hypothetical protein